jgi:hypothetical protein
MTILFISYLTLTNLISSRKKLKMNSPITASMLSKISISNLRSSDTLNQKSLSNQLKKLTQQKLKKRKKKSQTQRTLRSSKEVKKTTPSKCNLKLSRRLLKVSNHQLKRKNQNLFYLHSRATPSINSRKTWDLLEKFISMMLHLPL